MSDFGPDDDYFFDGSKLISIGKTGDLYQAIVFDGAGTLATMVKVEGSDEGYLRETFRLNSTGMLERVEKEY